MKYKISSDMSREVKTHLTSEQATESKTKAESTVIKPEWTLSEIILPADVKNEIDDIVSFCKQKSKIVDEWDLKKFLKGKGGTIGINFYGPAGTGKSILAEGLANATGKNLIKADYSEITDSLLGGTEKKLTQLFESAEKNNAVVFFDEADGLIGQRSSGSKSAENTNQIKSHLLTLLDRSNIVVVFATNLFENYDKAFFRRILFHIGFKLPDFSQRKSLWEFHLSERIPKEITYEALAEISDGLSGGDIKNITLKLCIKLSSEKIKSIDNEVVMDIIKSYKAAIEASQNPISLKNSPPIN
jgi:SpoVK/Ycf46/Vps4 family AAA+-type ATPase